VSEGVGARGWVQMRQFAAGVRVHLRQVGGVAAVQRVVAVVAVVAEMAWKTTAASASGSWRVAVVDADSDAAAVAVCDAARKRVRERVHSSRRTAKAVWSHWL
jgi:hypothetical protein